MSKSTFFLSLSNILFSLVLLLVFVQFPPRATAFHPTNETDKLALLAFKEWILEDPLGVMNSWNESFNLCEWRGVSCSKRHRGRVTGLDLAGQKLVGKLPPHIGNLSFLRGINLGQNFFNGEIPQEVGHLFRGNIPSNLSSCLHLEYIDFIDNELTSEIPFEIGTLYNNLRVLYITGNKLMGSIPQWLGNASSLTELSLGVNHLHGSIPDELGRLANLEFLQLGDNNLIGKIPLSIFNISSLYILSVAENRLHGRIPADIGFTLPNLEELSVPDNRFYGKVPSSLVNATKLEFLDLGGNNFSGVVPSNLGKLSNLIWLGLGENQLESAEGEGLGFISSLTNCSNLKHLILGRNHFKGEIPASIGNLSTNLEVLMIGGNRISGEIPKELGNLIGLTLLDISTTEVTGEIPSSIVELNNLAKILLFDSKLSGSIPPGLGNITNLLELSLWRNNLTGVIPPDLGNCSQLEGLDLSRNSLNGNVPKQLFILPQLRYLGLGRNHLIGRLPSEVGELIRLGGLSVSYNQLQGEIPSTLGKCSMLGQLWMDGNRFEGGIPSSFSNLKSLKALVLSENNLSGQIPKYLQDFTLLERLNLSFNNFDGEMPTGGAFGNTSIISVTGNQGLCGGIPQLGLSPCEIQRKERKGKLHDLKVVISAVVACSVVLLLMVVVLVILSYRRKLSQRKRAASPKVRLPEGFLKISYAELRTATSDFSSSNLLGEGCFGTVYRGTLGQDEVSIAVKVLNLLQIGASKSFIAECEALRNIRHRNLIKIVTVCSSIDFKGSDFKALVYEFMQNGSLHQLLHTNDEEDRAGGGSLSFIQRLNIAIDVACALEYLHNHCQPQIVHGDLKPSNVLLDQDMVAHVGDFGLARFLSSSQNQSSSIGLKGTIGYVAPEYGMNRKASKPGDVYAFGILLLEMLTGKRPIDAIFKDGFTIHQFTKTTLPERLVDILDPSLLQEVQDAENPRARNRGIGIRETLVVVARIGVLCSMQTPNERMGMKQAAAELNVVRDKFVGNRH